MRSTTLSEIKSDYLERVAAGLGDLPSEDRDEVLEDLVAHLAELQDTEVVSVLGDADSFVSEFRASAGLDQPDRLPRALATVRQRLDDWSQNLSRLTRWSSWRLFWIWTRGWLAVILFAYLSGGITFVRFPIPAIADSTAVGFVVVVAATVFSMWLDRQRRHPLRDIASILYSTVGVWALLAGLFSPITLEPPTIHVFDDWTSFDTMVAPDGQAVTNIYAYDLDGNPVEVLLFDQDGRPLRSLPAWVYEEAEHTPGETSFDYGEGVVIFVRDEFGRIIPNLYPLQTSTYDQNGRLTPSLPPSLGIPQPEGAASERPVTTTIGRDGQ